MSSYTIPSVVEKTMRGERAVDIYSRLLTDRIVYIGTEIDDGVANVVIAQLLHLESESPESPAPVAFFFLPWTVALRTWVPTRDSFCGVIADFQPLRFAFRRFLSSL